MGLLKKAKTAFFNNALYNNQAAAGAACGPPAAAGLVSAGGPGCPPQDAASVGVFVVFVVNVAVLELGLAGVTHFGDVDGEVERLTGQGVVAVDRNLIAVDVGN